jgi:hypothetical protein
LKQVWREKLLSMADLTTVSYTLRLSSLEAHIEVSKDTAYGVPAYVTPTDAISFSYSASTL